MATPIPQNTVTFSFDNLVQTTGGRILRYGSDVRGISTDSRALQPGSAFVALSGEHFDGHRFLQQAVERGASVLVIDRDVPLPDQGGVVLVNNTLSALADLARAHRQQWSVQHSRDQRMLIAVGGSAGKTTTARAIAALLSAMDCGQVHATLGNLNNAVGVPMTLFGLQDHHRFAVVEIGTNQRGEVSTLADIAKPDVAIVTSIGIEHTEGLGTLKDVANEEGDLYAALPTNGIAIGLADDPLVREQLLRAQSTRVLYGYDNKASYRIVSRKPQGLSGSIVCLNRGHEDIEFCIPLLGFAGTMAGVAAVCVVEQMLGERLSQQRITQAFAQLNPPRDGRLNVIELSDGTTVLDDTYNANPLSMRSSLKTASELASTLGRRLVLALGEMRELGALEQDEHITLGDEVVALRPAAVVAVAGAADLIATKASLARVPSWFAPTSHLAIEPLLHAVQPGDVVLVKGSRGIQMERIVDALIQHGGGMIHPSDKSKG